MSKPWDEITFVGVDNSHPPQLWAWAGSRDETAEPLFRVTQAELVEQWNVMHAEITRLTAENERIKIAAKLYYRCDGCGGIIVRAPGNARPCDKCDAPLGRPMMPDLWWHSENVRLTADLAEAREAARSMYRDLIDEGFRMDDVVELARWPWLATD